MATPTPNFNIDVLYLARKDELSEGGRYGYLRALADMQPRIDALVAALREIAIGRGPYSRDPLLHAENTIEAMKEKARAALKLAGKEA